MTLSKDMAIRMMINDKLRKKKKRLLPLMFPAPTFSLESRNLRGWNNLVWDPGGNPFWRDKRLIIIIFFCTFIPQIWQICSLIKSVITPALMWLPAGGVRSAPTLALFRVSGTHRAENLNGMSQNVAVAQREKKLIKVDNVSSPCRKALLGATQVRPASLPSFIFCPSFIYLSSCISDWPISLRHLRA